MKFYLVRHGEKENLPMDPPLTPLGLEQARKTSRHLRNISFKKILSSPKTRTKQTAKIIADEIGAPVIERHEFQERLEWEDNETFDEFLSEWYKTDLDRNYLPKHGRGSIENGKNAKSMLEKLEKEYGDGNVLIVTHGGTIGDLLRNLFKDLPHVPAKLNPEVKYIKIHECSITVIEKQNDNYKLIQLSDTTHLS